MSSKLRCLLLDDELPGLSYLKLMCEQLPDLEVVKAFDSPELFLKEKDGLTFDFCIMDIQMPGLDGLSVANLMRGTPIIFTTAYSEYAAEAYDLNVVDYVRKPIRMERLETAIAKVRERLKKPVDQGSFILVNTDRGKALLRSERICYICSSEQDSRDKLVWMDDHTSVVVKNITFQELLKQLPANGFCQVNKREIIALPAVQYYSADLIETNLIDNQGRHRQVSVGEAYRGHFIRWMEQR